MQLVGEDKFVWGSDLPHAEGQAHPVVELQKAIAGVACECAAEDPGGAYSPVLQPGLSGCRCSG
jgi:hypothetical protein